MNKQRSSRIATSIWQKTALVLSGLFLSLLFLEVGMRLGGFILSSMQVYENFQSTKQKGAYRILCIGESTTERAYPHLLEQVLNQRNIGVRFSVIDKGKSGIDTSTIVGFIESNLAEYRPDMVVAMMGVNDRGGHMPLEELTTSKAILFIQSLRVYQLIRFLWLHIVTKAKEMGSSKAAYAQTVSVNVETSLSDTEQKEVSTEAVSDKKSRKKVIERDPNNDDAFVELGRLRKEQGKLSEAEDLFKKALLLNPKNDQAYAQLGKLYSADHRISEAEDAFKNAMRLNPRDYDSFFDLGLLYRVQGNDVQAEAIFNKAIALNPKNAYLELGRLFLAQGRFAEGEDSFKKVLALDPENGDAYFEVGQFYRAQRKFHQAEDFFKKALEFNPKDEQVLGAMAVLCEEKGEAERAEEYAAKANQSHANHIPSVMVDSYWKLKKILDQKKIKLVCVQYPMRSVEPLKRIFENDKDVIFVDNERIFKDAVKKGSYKEYFKDMFAGDFGHCTLKGNELLARNIADVILREVFDR